MKTGPNSYDLCEIGDYTVHSPFSGRDFLFGTMTIRLIGPRFKDLPVQ